MRDRGPGGPRCEAVGRARSLRVPSRVERLGQRGRQRIAGPDRRGGPPLAEPPHVAKHEIQALAGDVLHGVVEDPLVLAEVEDLDDVRVVQPRRRAGLVAEPSPVGRRVTTPRVQDFQGHVGAERFTFGLVHNPHAPGADLAEDPVIAQALRQDHAWRTPGASHEGSGRPSGARLEPLDLDEGGE